MKIDRYEISKKLKQLKSVTPPKIGDKVTGILFKNNMLIANNLELVATAALDVETDECFVIPLSAIDLIDNLQGGEISITERHNKITVESQSGRSSFPTFSPDEFPDVAIPKIDKLDKSFDYDGEAIAEAINKVMYACGNNPSRPVMGGVLLESDGAMLNIVACDGYRLSWNQIGYTGELKAIIPKAALQKVLSLGLKGGMNLYLFGHNRVAFQTGEYSVYSRLLEGDFINYKSMFTDSYVSKASVKRIEMLNATTRALICSAGNTTARTIIESESNDNLTVRLQNTANEFQEQIQIEGENTEKMKIAFNARLLIDCLKASDEDNIDVFFTSDVKPLIVNDGVLKQIVLPVRM